MMQDVRERRAKSSRYLNDPDFKKQCDAENRAKFKQRMEQEKAENPEPRFGIIIPMAPFGMPEYDGGERFDLRVRQGSVRRPAWGGGLCKVLVPEGIPSSVAC